MTWEEFKQAVEEAGVRDSDVIRFVDVHSPEKEDFEEGGRITIFEPVGGEPSIGIISWVGGRNAD